MALEPGYLVSKQVRLVRKFKGGGMGSVWIADHLGLNTEVAVKFISGDHVANPELTARFKREATSAAGIKSPHVVQVHDHGVTDEGLPFIVMELLEGEDLSTRLKRRGPMSADDVATIIEQTCRVLSRAHKLGIVHRDIKPANLFMVESDGAIFVKLLDFGVAKLENEASDLTNTGSMVGTIAYMSPEQLLDARSVDHRADLWSLAVVAYRALTGQLPFKDDNGLGAFVLAVDRGVFPQASGLVAGIPEKVDPWFARTFTRQIDARFPSAKEMSNALSAALGRKVSTEESAPVDHAAFSDHHPSQPTPISRTKLGLNAPALPASKPAAPAQPAARPRDPEDSGTVGGLSTPPARKRGSLFARGLMAVTLLVVVGIGGALLFARLTPPGPTVSATIASDPPAPAPAPSDVAAADPAPSARGIVSEPTATQSAATAPASASAPPPDPASSAALLPSASASAPPGGAKGRLPTGRPRTERDYGF